MTLSRWLRDYLYIPLGGSRRGTIFTYRNLMLTMLIGGLWHGAAWTFVVWGGIHGAGLCLERWWRSRPGYVERPSTFWNRTWARVATFHVVCLAWIFFRADSFGTAWDLITGLFTRWGEGAPLVTAGVLASDRGRDRLAVPAGAHPAPCDGTLLAVAGRRSGRRPGVRADAHVGHGAGGRGTLHLLPVLMPDTPRPPRRDSVLPPHPAAEYQVTEESVRLPRQQRPGRTRRTADGRRLWSAGHALVVSVFALALGLLLNAPGTHKSAYNQPDGWQRDVALAFTGPLADVSHALFLDRPRAAVQSAIGRSGDDEIDVEIALPAKGGAPPAKPPAAKPGKAAFTPKRKLRLWIAGDSLVITPGYAIARAAAATPVIEAVGGVEGRVATGLERPDVFNWFDEVRTKLKELEPRAVVLGFGANDDKAYMTGLPAGVSIDEFGSASWEREYRRRVGGLMDLVTRAGAHLVWVGLPITRSPEQTRRFDVINAAVVAEVRRRPAGRQLRGHVLDLRGGDRRVLRLPHHVLRSPGAGAGRGRRAFRPCGWQGDRP